MAFRNPEAFSLGDVGGGVPDALLRAALVLESEIKRLLLTPGRGRIYRRGKTRTHQASAPGDPPAPDAGNLLRSITHEVVSPTTVRVGTNVEYAEPLEFGTVTAGRGRRTVILPRPFMRPAMAAVEPMMTEAVETTLRRSTFGSGRSKS
ncbi:MAG: hypothetical protein H0U59_03945 [Gemmatimonadaceae bacterium]|nr:hypothetical protein [Gemmatimonadaceae bacterium]